MQKSATVRIETERERREETNEGVEACVPRSISSRLVCGVDVVSLVDCLNPF